MVIVHIKRGDKSAFLYEADLKAPVRDVLAAVTLIYNGRLKVDRICSEIEYLAKNGTQYPPEILGLTEEQVEELKLVDEWGERCVPSGGWDFHKDDYGRRNGRAPKPKMQEVLTKTVAEAKEMISTNLVLRHTPITQKVIQSAISLLKGAVTIVYPMKLPPHDVIRQEFDNIEDLSGTQASLEVIEPSMAQLWFCGKEMEPSKPLEEYLGRNNKSTVILKLQKKAEGAPGREPVISEDTRKDLMVLAYRKQEEYKKMDQNQDDEYLNADWADTKQMKRAFQGLKDVSWRPK